MSRRRFLATVLALPAALTQCSPEPVVPQMGTVIRMLDTVRFSGCRVGVIRSKDGKTARLVKMVNGQWTSC